MLLPLGLLAFTILLTQFELKPTAYPYGYTTRVLVDATLGIVNRGEEWHPSISADGRYVAFNAPYEYIDYEKKTGYSTTRAYVYDRKTGEVVCASTMNDGTLVDGHEAVISANGQYVVFASGGSPLTGAYSTPYNNIYVRDLIARSTTLVSIAYNEQPANGSSRWPSISANGRFVAFQSDASNLVKGDTNQVTDIFVYDLRTGKMQRASVDSQGVQFNGPSRGSAIAGKGRYVAFFSETQNQTTGSYYRLSVYLHNLNTGQTTMISERPNFVANSFILPAINDDGHYIVFSGGYATSDPNQLVLSGTYLYDRLSGSLAFLVKGLNGDLPSNLGASFTISADGRYIAFESMLTNLVQGSTARYNGIFVLDREKGTFRQVSISTTNNLPDRNSFNPFISADGQHVVFGSLAQNLVEGYVHGAIGVYIHDLSNWDDYPRSDALRFSQAVPFPGPYPPPESAPRRPQVYPYPAPGLPSSDQPPAAPYPAPALSPQNPPQAYPQP